MCTFLRGDRRSGGWGSCCFTIFTSAMNFTVLDQLENLTLFFFIYCGLFVLILVGFFWGVFFCFFFHYVSAKFHLWPSSGDLPRPRIGMLSLVTVSPVITAFYSCCLSHHVFDQFNRWPAWIGFETAIFWQCSPGTVETQRLYPLRHGPRRTRAVLI